MMSRDGVHEVLSIMIEHAHTIKHFFVGQILFFKFHIAQENAGSVQEWATLEKVFLNIQISPKSGNYSVPIAHTVCLSLIDKKGIRRLRAQKRTGFVMSQNFQFRAIPTT